MTFKRPILICCAMLLLLAAPAALSGAPNGKIVVLVSSNDAPFRQAVSGFSELLANKGVHSPVEIVTLEGDAARARQAVRSARAADPRLLFTVGSLATDAAVSEVRDVPIVACLVLRTDLLRRAQNATGVGLEFSPDVQFDWMRRFLPDVGTVGIMYNAAENQKKVDAAAEAARRAGFRLETERIGQPQDVPAALNSLAKRVDVLWSIPDGIVLSPVIAKNVLLFSFRNSIPVVGPSATWVKAGALYSLDWDYVDLGGQCGEIAVRIIEGTPPASIPAAPPRTVKYSINLSTARQMKISLPDQVVRGAKQTY